MTRRTHIDLTGAVALTAFAVNLALNQVVIKVSNGGFQPVFMAALRSAGALVVLAIWMKARGISLRLPRASVPGGVLAGSLFALEFILLFNALDLTTVSRASILFYAMPIWLALASHVLLPGERLTALRMLGMALAMGGVVLALADRSAGQGSLLGDLLALGAGMCWGGIALSVRTTSLSAVPAAQQLFWQLLVSAPLLLIAALFFGDLIRDLQPLHVAGLIYQILAIASFGFLFWFWLLKIYPASGVASFSFLSPVFSVLLGWLILGEQVGLSIWLALGLVAAGLVLINRR
ncbi:DMT family transporter [uncultured Tateyamaria sp.]|uniref:DMT family transporter n=1 Tax=uncultured Tateyamaria sp. TaxID=455651 RepID=UPI002602D67B|nr:DMT family transporter [uncultured Tateyamaria sp.]